jgi:CelD/BcsL family acetyltransferase involved in cellulose biosynthesis
MSDYQLALLSRTDVNAAPELRDVWNELVQSSGNLHVLYQSPDWWECTQDEPAGQKYLAVVSERGGRTVGLCPVQLANYPLTYDLLGKRFCQQSLRIVDVLGGLPLLPEDDAIHLQFLESLLAKLPAADGLLLKNIRSDSFCWAFLHRSRELCGRMLEYHPEGLGAYHSITLTPTFDEYLSKFSANAQKKLRKKLDRFQNDCGRLELRRFEDASEVDFFLKKAAAISQRTWQKLQLGIEIDDSPGQAAFFKRCADRGMFRSYLLKCGRDFCSFGLGYQYQDIYYYKKIGFDERWARYSPGTVQLYLVLDDVIKHRPVQRFDFENGDWGFKRRFGTEHLAATSVLLLRRNTANRLRVAGHAFYHSLVQGLKQLVGRNRDFVRPERNGNRHRSPQLGKRGIDLSSRSRMSPTVSCSAATARGEGLDNRRSLCLRASPVFGFGVSANDYCTSEYITAATRSPDAGNDFNSLSHDRRFSFSSCIDCATLYPTKPATRIAR